MIPLLPIFTTGRISSVDKYAERGWGGKSSFGPAKSFNWICEWDPATENLFYRQTLVVGFTPPDDLVEKYTMKFRGTKKEVVFNKGLEPDFTVKYLVDSDWKVLSSAYIDLTAGVTQLPLGITTHLYFNAVYLNGERGVFGFSFVRPEIIEVIDDDLEYNNSSTKTITVKYSYQIVSVWGGIA